MVYERLLVGPLLATIKGTLMVINFYDEHMLYLLDGVTSFGLNTVILFYLYWRIAPQRRQEGRTALCSSVQVRGDSAPLKQTRRG